VFTQWKPQVLRDSLRKLRETLVPKNCVMFINIEPGSNAEKIKKLLELNFKKMKKHPRVFFKNCEPSAIEAAVAILGKKFPEQTFFNFSSYVTKNVTNISSFNEIGIIQNESVNAMA
jgi:hypothetical protein